MKSVTIRESHMNTGRVVRGSAHGNIFITERRQPVAVLKSAKAADLVGKPFPKRDIRKMRRSNVDSTMYICQDRGGR